MPMRWLQRARPLIGLTTMFVLLAPGCATTEHRTARDDLGAGANTLTDELAGKLALLAKRLRVGVLPFTDSSGNVYVLGEYLAEKIITRLGARDHIELIERARLDRLMTEHRLSDLTSQQSVASIADMLGADALIIGSVTVLGAYVDVNARIVEPASGRVLGTATARVRRTAAIDDLWRPGKGRVANASDPQPPLPKRLYVEEDDASSPWPWVLAGVGVLAGGVGATLGYTAQTALEVSPIAMDYDQSVESAEARALGANISYGVASVSALIALVLFIVDGSSSSDADGASDTEGAAAQAAVAGFGGFRR